MIKQLSNLADLPARLKIPRRAGRSPDLELKPSRDGLQVWVEFRSGTHPRERGELFGVGGVAIVDATKPVRPRRTGGVPAVVADAVGSAAVLQGEPGPLVALSRSVRIDPGAASTEVSAQERDYQGGA